MFGGLCVWTGRFVANQETQGGGKVGSILNNVNIIPRGYQFVGFDGREATANHDSAGVPFGGLSQRLSAFGRGGMCHTASVDNEKVRAGRDIDAGQAVTLEKVANLLTLVLVNFTSEG